MRLAVTWVNRHDRKLVRDTLDSLVIGRPTPTAEHPQGRCLEKGSDDHEVRDTLVEFGFTTHMRARGEEVQAIKAEARQKTRRSVVERTYSGTYSGRHCFRRVLIRWDKHVQNYLAFLHVACAYITYRQSGLLR
jgi:putative transposase